MKRPATILLLVITASLACSCTIFDKSDSVTVVKPRLHKTWPKKHKWHKKLKVWKFTIQMPERGGGKKVKMKG